MLPESADGSSLVPGFTSFFSGGRAPVLFLGFVFGAVQAISHQIALITQSQLPSINAHMQF